MRASTDSESLTETLGQFVVETDGACIPERVRERARISLVHNLCVAIAGRGRNGVAEAFATRFHPTPAEATLLGSGRLVAAEAAAFANGALFHARSQDDTHAGSTSHPGAPVTAAALALGEKEGASGQALLDALVFGYEALCRIGRDVDEMVTKRGFRSAAVFGGFGSAAASARILGLSREQAAHALAFAAHQAGGLAEVWVEGSAEFPLQLGLAARSGVTSARLALVGMTAARFPLEGPSGLYAAYAGAVGPFPEALEGLGAFWQFDEVTVKAFPACAILQGPLGLFQDMLVEAGGVPVEAVDVALAPYEADYPGIDNAGPAFASPTATKMSAQFCLAVMAHDRRLRMDDLARLDDPAIGALAANVTVVRDPQRPVRTCSIRARLADGRTLHGALDGAAGRPDFAGISAFARAMAPEMGMTVSRVDRLLEAVAGIDDQPDLSALIGACRV
jgi:2-methylcitrate dehydratase PrpD